MTKSNSMKCDKFDYKVLGLVLKKFSFQKISYKFPSREKEGLIVSLLHNSTCHFCCVQISPEQRSHTSLVISPLRSLMRDQRECCIRMGIAAVCVMPEMTQEERDGWCDLYN